jgi:hypothetical protein
MKLLLATIIIVAALLGGGPRGYWQQIPAAGNTCQTRIWVPATPRRAGFWRYPAPGYCFVWVNTK